MIPNCQTIPTEVIPGQKGFGISLLPPPIVILHEYLRRFDESRLARVREF